MGSKWRVLISFLLFQMVAFQAFSQGSTAGEDGTLEICSNQTLTSSMLFNSLGGAPDLGGVWTPALAGAGVYTYTVGNDSATITVSQSTAPESGTALPPAVFCGVKNFPGLTYDLFDLLEGEDQTGIWIDDDGTGLLNGSNLALDLLPVGAYNFTYDVDAIGFCDDVDVTVQVEITPTPNAGVPMEANFCEAEMPTSLDLFSQLIGADSDGLWLDNNATGALQGSLVDLTLLSSGIYNFTYTISSEAGCESSASVAIIIDSALEAPTITIDNITYNCDGTANVEVLASTSIPLSLTYYLNGIENNGETPQSFTNLAIGTHTLSVDYQSQNTDVKTLLIEDFGTGSNTTTPYISSDFCFEDQTTTPFLCNGFTDTSNVISDGKYSVTSSINNLISSLSGNLWVSPLDNTSSGTDPNGRYLVVNFGYTIPENTIIYEQQLNNIIPNKPLKVELSAFNILNSIADSPPISSWPVGGHGYINADLRLSLLDENSSEVAFISTGDIPKDTSWHDYSFSLNPGNNTSLRFVITSNVPSKHPDGNYVEGNEVAIDDIKVSQNTSTCSNTLVVPITIEPDASVPSAGGNASINVCNENVVSEAELFAALQNADLGGAWSPDVLGSGTYTYTVDNGDCSDSSQVVVTFNDAINCLPDVDVVISITAPNIIRPGETISATVYYSATTQRDIQIYLEAISSGKSSQKQANSNWVLEDLRTVEAGRDSYTVEFTVPDLPISTGAYQWGAYMTTVGGGEPEMIGSKVVGAVVDIDESLNLDDNISQSVLQVYPNPVNKILSINSIKDDIVKLFTLQGKVVMESKIFANDLTELDVSNLETGLYFITSKTNSFKPIKFVKR